MKKDLHPDLRGDHGDLYLWQHVHDPQHAASGKIHADVCSQCHPFYTGKQKILDTGGRVARFEPRYGKKAEPSSSPARRSRAWSSGSGPAISLSAADAHQPSGKEVRHR